jgi:hypothetical protein
LDDERQGALRGQEAMKWRWRNGRANASFIAAATVLRCLLLDEPRRRREVLRILCGTPAFAVATSTSSSGERGSGQVSLTSASTPGLR